MGTCQFPIVLWLLVFYNCKVQLKQKGDVGYEVVNSGIYFWVFYIQSPYFPG